MRTTTKWIHGEEFESRQDHHPVRLDGSGKHGVSPKAVLLSALAACSGIDVVEILRKMRVPFESLEIDAQARMTTTIPKIFEHIELVFRIDADPKSEERIHKAIRLSLDKYCGVATMLRKNCAISYRLMVGGKSLLSSS
ncbi:MAG TPA: OsmC family protein [Chitinophagaceae bacterium]|nr:OsmC family protein [Chitinophagaceae bacterium]